MIRACSASLALALATVVAGCRDVPHAKPSPPTLDVREAKTSRLTYLLTGAAEPGARVVVTRLPLFAPAEVPAATFAGTSDARFAVTVPLVKGLANEFLVSVMDSAGEGSDATTAEVEQVAPWPTRVDLALFDDRPALGANGLAALEAQATLTFAEGAPPDGRQVIFHVDGYTPAPADLVANVDSSGRAVVTFGHLTATGAGRLVASVPDGSVSSDALPFVVRAGPPASATLTLSATLPSGAVTGTDLTVPAGVDVTAHIEAKDAAGDEVNPGWSLSASPADALVAGGVARFTRAGEYTLTARLVGADVSASAHVTVTEGPPMPASRLAVSLSGPATSGVPLPFTLALTDPDGAPVTPDQVAVALSDAKGTGSVANGTVTFQTAGWQSATFTAKSLAQTFTETAWLYVRPGPATKLALTVDGAPAPLSTPHLASPGEALTLAFQATDAAGNALADAPVSLTADAPVSLFGLSATAPEAAGTYAVVGRVAGSSTIAVAVLQVASQPPAALSLSCPAEAVAGTPFSCRATATDANGQALATSISYTVTPPDGATIGANSLTLTKAGDAQVTATIAGTSIAAKAEVSVRPGPASDLALAVTPGSIAVGETAGVAATVTDAFGNVRPDEVALSTDLPGAVVAGGAISNVAHAGGFHVFARTPSVSAAADLTVTAGASTSVRLAVSPTSAEVGTPLTVRASALDEGGNPTADVPAITVDGAAPDGVHASLDGSTLVLEEPGAHVVEASVGDARDAAVVVVTPAPDTLAPEVSLTLDAAIYKPGATVKATVRARDDRGLAGARVRASSAALGTLVDRQLAPAPSTELEQVVSFTLPADLVGPFTVTATASDTANHSADAPSVDGLSDFHFDRLSLPGFPSTAVARSVSIDGALTLPTGLGFANGVPYTASLATPNPPAKDSAVVSVGAGGRVQSAWALGDGLANPDGLAASPGGMLFMPALVAPGTGDSPAMMRLVPGVPAPEQYTVPPLASNRPDLRLAGPSIASGAMTLFVAARSTDAAAATPGLVYSMPVKEAALATVDPTKTGGAEEVFASALADLRPVATCVAGPSPTAVLFTATRDGATPKVGLYSLPLVSGHVPDGAAAPQAVFEENATVAGGTVRYGACLAGPGGKILFARWVEAADGSTSNGRLSACAPASGCTPADALVAASGASLGSLDGLAKSGTSLFVAETAAGRLLRVDGAF